MKIENQVCTLEQAKKLKELGVDCISLFQWRDFSRLRDNMVAPLVSYDRAVPSHASVMQVFNAFTVAELGVMLPYSVKNPTDAESYYFVECEIYNENPKNIGCNSYLTNFTGNIHSVKHKNTEAEARAAMLIYLLEQRLVSSQQVNEKLAQ